jgi:hypothetical protein
LKLGTAPFKPLLPGSRSMTAAALTDKLGELHSLTKPVDFDRLKE